MFKNPIWALIWVFDCNISYGFSPRLFLSLCGIHGPVLFSLNPTVKMVRENLACINSLRNISLINIKISLLHSGFAQTKWYKLSSSEFNAEAIRNDCRPMTLFKAVTAHHKCSCFLIFRFLKIKWNKPRPFCFTSKLIFLNSSSRISRYFRARLFALNSLWW